MVGLLVFVCLVGLVLVVFVLFWIWYQVLCIEPEHYNGSRECVTQLTDFTNKKMETNDVIERHAQGRRAE